MNMLKRSFAMLLALCMLVSAVPVNAFAAEATDLTEPIVLETDAPEVTEAPIESETPTESEVPTESEIPTEGETTSEEETPTEGVTVPEEETPTEGETIGEEETPAEGVTVPEEETVPEETEEFFEIGWVSEEEISGVTMGENPGTGITNSEPFPQGTGGSNSFRIPALVTLSNGNLVAAADARWNSTLDNGGIDTILSISSNGGDTWEWSFPNYLGDNGNFYNNASTCFIDPALAVTGNTIYMLVDLYPYGVAITSTAQEIASTAVGFNSEGKLLLSNDDHKSYGYYLDGTTIRDSSGNAVSGYTVDEYFNITKAADNTTTNLFFEDSPYKVVRTGYLYLTKSTNGGETWSAPTLIPNVKTTSEYSCLVGPGRGLVTSKGTIVFPVYKYAGSTNSQVMSFIYSTDSGATWTRSANCGVSWSSEAAVVELSDGTLRFFYRNGNALLSYVDYSFTTGWGSEVKTAVPTNSNTQLSAITYSKTIGGKQVILVSCPTGANPNGSTDNSGSARVNGKIFAFTVEADKTLNKVGSVDVTSNGAQFMYSCLTERKDGAVSILYEDQESNWGTGDNSYYTMDFKTYSESELETALGVTFDEDANTGDSGEEITNKVNVSLKVGETVKQTIEGVGLTGSNTDTSVATVTWAATTTEGGTTEKLTAVTLPTSTGSVQCYISDGNGNYLSNNGTTLTNATSVEEATKWTITYVDTPAWDTNTNNMSRYNVSATINGYTYYVLNNSGLSLNRSNASNANHWHTAENGFFGGMAGTSGWNFDGTSWTVNSSGYGNANVYDVETVTGEATSSTTVIITGNTVGTTSVTVGSTKYNITVVPENITNVVDVELEVGESMTYTDSTGNYEGNSNNVAPNAAVAGMKVEGTTIAGDATITPVTALITGDTFYIQVSEGVYRTANGGTTDELSDAELWKVSFYFAQMNWVTLQNENGQSLRVDNSSITVGTQATYFSFDVTKGIYYDTTNDVAVGHPVQIVGTEAVNATDITFTGIAAGETIAVVGTTQYNITVMPPELSVVDIELEIGETFTYTDTTGNYEANITQQPDAAKATMAVTGTVNATEKKLVPVTAATFTTGKRYVIENVRASGNQADHSVLTSTEAYGGLDMNGPLDVASSQTWTIIPDDNDYQITRNSEYVYIAAGAASMESTAYKLTMEYVEGRGWLISYGDYYLSDLNGTNSGEAFGYGTRDDDGNYWNIYEVVDETTAEGTKVAFTGVAEGTTTATVGYTQYNITVVPTEVDDEVMNSATDTWTVDPEVQRQRYNALTGLSKDLYTDDSWKQYETARQNAYNQLAKVTNATYASEADAEAALSALTAAMDALEAAKGKLVSAKTISVRYTLNGAVLDTREYKVTADETALTLPATIVVNDVAYEVSTTDLALEENQTTYSVEITKVGALGGGFVASKDINAGTHNDHPQIADLVDDAGNKKKITEMTFTVGISYDLDLATTIQDGYSVKWETGNESVATVDPDGNVTATGEGTTTIVATVMDADGNVVEVNSIPITVLAKGTDDRMTSIYIEEINNTTVWCSVNAATTEPYLFEVVEGELIYGQFDTAQNNGSTHTTAISFFGDPDEAHALTYMKSTGSDDQYFLLHDDDGNLYDGTVTPSANYYVSGTTGGAGYWQAVGLGNNQTGANANWQLIKDMVQEAINRGCDGGLGFTRRQSEGDLASNLSFASDPMPRIEKEIDGVLATSRKQADYRTYTPGMVAAVHELVYFKITVTQEVPITWADTAKTIGAIEYKNAWVRDTILPGAYLYNKELDEADGTYDGEIAEDKREQEDEITDDLNSAWTAEQKAAGKRTFEYYLMYEIKDSDIPKFFIDNIADLEYDYQSKYSTGAQAGVANAEARISVVGTAIDDVVIDFGQSFTYTGLTNVHLKGVYTGDEAKATATYGTVTVEKEQRKDENGNLIYDDKNYPEYDYTVVYTPTSILQGVDTVVMYGIGDENHEKIINGFLVYPATTVYYEEGFMLNDSDKPWDGDAAARATGEQTFELLGESQYDDHGMLTHKITNQKYAYGYDPLYEEAAYDYGDSYASAATIGQKTTFTFTGTGFDLYANCTTETGRVSVQVKDTAGKLVKLYTVDTVVQVGDTPATNDGNELKEEFHLPIVSVEGLDHGTYTVSLVKIAESVKDVKIDGVRIHNTVKDSSVFNIDLEDNPVFQELRDLVLTAVDVNKTASEDYGDNWMTTAKIGPLAEQVYGSIVTGDEEVSAVVTSVANIYGEGATAQDLLDNGPKNELFLYPGQTLTFNVETKREMQIGLKAPRAATAYTLTYKVGNETTAVATGKALNTSVDMFYNLADPAADATTYTVSVTNTGNDILSVTDLKICDDPNAAFVPLTVEDIEYILTQAGVGGQEPAPEEPTDPEEPIVPEEPEVPVIEYADAVLKINLVDYTGKQLAAAELTANGIKGEENAFAGAAVLRMAERNLPKGYALVTKQADTVKVAYGEETTVSVQIGKVATVKVTFVNLLGRKVGTATITKVQNDAAPCRITAAEIRSLAPVGRLVIRLTSVTAAFGSTTNVIVPVV